MLLKPGRFCPATDRCLLFFRCCTPLWAHNWLQSLVAGCCCITTGCYCIIALAQHINTGCHDNNSVNNDPLLCCNGHCRKEMIHCRQETIPIQVAAIPFQLLWFPARQTSFIAGYNNSMSSCNKSVTGGNDPIQKNNDRMLHGKGHCRKEMTRCSAATVVAGVHRSVAALSGSNIRKQQHYSWWKCRKATIHNGKSCVQREISCKRSCYICH